MEKTDCTIDDLRAALYLHRLASGETAAEIAEHEGVHRNNVSLRIRQAIDHQGAERIRELTRPPRLVPIYPNHLTPNAACPHCGPIEGPFYCEVCGQTGFDSDPRLRRPAGEPQPRLSALQRMRLWRRERWLKSGR